ncbi:MAG: heavy metal-associated domain-containing protein [Chloroflexota bacterium]
MRAHELRIPIYGLGCGGGGATTIERELGRAPGVLRVYVNPATEVAYVDFDPAQTDPTRLARVIDQTGYRAGPAVEA